LELWILEGCWFKTVNYDSLDYSSSDAVKITTSIRFDNARQDIIGFTTESGFPGGTGTALGGAGSITPAAP
jgi:hypothetical protein